MNEGDSWENISEDLLTDCAQLTKANSIEGLSIPKQYNCTSLTVPGNKKNNITIVYTPWSNLKKDGSMAVGQVGFHDQKLVSRCVRPPIISCGSCDANSMIRSNASMLLHERILL